MIPNLTISLSFIYILTFLLWHTQYIFTSSHCISFISANRYSEKLERLQKLKNEKENLQQRYLYEQHHMMHNLTLCIDNTEFSFCFRVIKAMDKKVEADQLVSIFVHILKDIKHNRYVFKIFLTIIAVYFV